MSRGPCHFKQRDVTAAVKALRAAGCEVAGIEFDPASGRVRVLTGRGNDSELPADTNEWDNWLNQKKRNPNQ
jgi:hypothetical protein